MINKKRLRKLFFASGTIGMVASFLPIVLVNNSNNVLFNNSTTNNANNDSTVDSKTDKLNELQPIDFNDSWPLLSTDSGPITSNKNIISALDWFASTRWSINVLELKWENKKIFGDNPKFVKWTDRAFINWDFDRKNNFLWILTNGQYINEKVQKQKIIKINANNGEVLLVKEINFNPEGHKTESQYNLYYSISALNSGKVMMYSQGTADWFQFDIFDPYKNTIETLNSNTREMVKPIEDDLNSKKTKGDVRVRFFFPISNNINILVLTNYGWWDQNGYDKNDFGDLWIVLVDDNMNKIGDKNAVKVVERSEMGELNSEGDTFPKLSYSLADGRVLFTAYNKIFIFFTSEILSTKSLVYKEFNYGIKVNQKYVPVESWTTDTDNNVYVKLSGDNKIYKVRIIGNSHSNTDFHLSTYYDISGSQIGQISKYSSSFVIYNVYGYSGQIMLLNPRKVTDKTQITQIDNVNDQNYGLAAAIVQNKNSDGGDSKGLLNTNEAFIKSSDFDIDKNILKNKLPSEITRKDLTISNDGFLTNNTEKDEHGKNKYPQFEKRVMNDANNNSPNLTITANIDQIPWFVNNGIMPSNIPPLTITKSFTTDQNIDSRISWKNVDLDYDFKNTLPSKVDLNDVQRFDPFSINLSSQQTTVGGQKYPQKSYSISEQNDGTGNIKITATIKYLPIDVDATESNIKTQSFHQNYTIFKKDSKKEFNFVGDKNNTSEDIRNIPQLKNLSESNLLPSSFKTSDPSSILRFINTDTSTGYPISKMNFDVVANDNNGTLTISGSLPPEYYPDEGTKLFAKTYTGLNKISDYAFTINQQSQGLDKKKYRPSEINEQFIYGNFVVYKGFNSSDITLELIPNDETGELTLKFSLSSDYPEIVANNSGFKLNGDIYLREEKIVGFKTNAEYKTQYEVKFIDDNSAELDGIKKYTPKQIEQSINPKSTDKVGTELIINGNMITSEKDLAIAVIDMLGANLPKKDDLKNDSNFLYNIYYNDPNGEITVKLTFKNVSGVSGDLVFIQRFTGFAKGNQVTTDDILSFKTQTKLMNDNPDFKNSLPSELAAKLNDNSIRINEIKKYISYYSGMYETAIDSNKFTLEVIADDIYGYLTIKIIFSRDEVTNPDSLLSYTATYKGFKTE